MRFTLPTLTVFTLMLGFVALPSHTANAAVTFSDDFADDTVNSTPDNPPWNVQLDPAFGEFEVRADTANNFGEGTTNQFLRYRDRDAGNGMQLGATGVSSPDPIQNQQFILSFDLFDEDDSVAQGEMDLSFTIPDASVTNTASSTTVGSFGFNEGNIEGSAGYTTQTEQAFEVWVNNTDDSLTFNGNTINARSLSVFVEGSLVVDNLAAFNAASADIGGFGFHTDGATRAQMQFDNFEVNVIPEPASLALLGLGGLMVIGRRNRR